VVVAAEGRHDCDGRHVDVIIWLNKRLHKCSFL
jgi:hypothetical protein